MIRKRFQHLFACDDVAYSMVVVDGWDSLVRALEEHAEQIHTAILINCGSNRALTSFEFASNMTLYVIDSRRPYDLDNVNPSLLSVSVLEYRHRSPDALFCLV